MKWSCVIVGAMLAGAAVAQFPFDNQDPTTTFGASVGLGVPARDIVGNAMSNRTGYSVTQFASRGYYTPAQSTTNFFAGNLLVPRVGTFECWWYAGSSTDALYVVAGGRDPNNALSDTDYDLFGLLLNGGLLTNREVALIIQGNYTASLTNNQAGAFVVRGEVVQSNAWNHVVCSYDFTRRMTNNAVTTNAVMVVNGTARTVHSYVAGASSGAISNNITLPYFGLGAIVYQIGTTGAPTRSTFYPKSYPAFVRVLNRSATVNEAQSWYSGGPR